MKTPIIVLCCLFALFVHLEAQDSHTPDEMNIAALIAQFSSADLFVHGDAITQIVRYGETAVTPLIRSLSDSSAGVRICSAIALGKIAPKGSQAIPALTLSLQDTKSDVRWCSAIALGKYKKTAASSTNELVRTLSDPERNIR